MAQKIYVVEGRKFRTEADYQNALKDQQVIENLRVQTKKMSLADQKKLLEVIRSGRCRFHSILGQDYMEELSEDIQRQDGKPVDLSYKEFELMTYFAENQGIALSREKILNNVWNYDYFGDARTIDTHVKKLRSKLGEKGEYIKTIWGMGYKFEVSE